MRKRCLGNSGLEIAPLAFGGNVFGWTADERTSFKLLDAFVAAGFNLIDTANVYSRFARAIVVVNRKPLSASG
jgi:aryl-alcohol dehydrogenase-like predicted oxidoreductase